MPRPTRFLARWMQAHPLASFPGELAAQADAHPDPLHSTLLLQSAGELRRAIQQEGGK